METGLGKKGKGRGDERKTLWRKGREQDEFRKQSLDAIWYLKCLNDKSFNISETHILFTKYDHINLIGLSRELKEMVYVQTSSVQRVGCRAGQQAPQASKAANVIQQQEYMVQRPLKWLEELSFVLMALTLFPNESLHYNGASTGTVCQGGVNHPPLPWSTGESPVHSVQLESLNSH